MREGVRRRGRGYARPQVEPGWCRHEREIFRIQFLQNATQLRPLGTNLTNSVPQRKVQVYFSSQAAGSCPGRTCVEGRVATPWSTTAPIRTGLAALGKPWLHHANTLLLLLPIQNYGEAFTVSARFITVCKSSSLKFSRLQTLCDLCQVCLCRQISQEFKSSSEYKIICK